MQNASDGINVDLSDGAAPTSGPAISARRTDLRRDRMASPDNFPGNTPRYCCLMLS
jgi:hypothetical protein